MKLRPHHLLCTQGYSGKGYSPDFIANMTAVTDLLRGGEPVSFELVFSTDDLCAKCPDRLGENRCRSQEKVQRLDRKVAEAFHLQAQTYVYQDLIRAIDARMTVEMMDDICGECEWYPVSACKRNVLRGADVREPATD